ncbi:hypothetical protein C3E79_02600 [Corynebacterium liangguodongii]|uniref:RNase H type-1 domain-containing protein n=2 Tax=Corynebacterium liangguodongii TaxID=2079535 RepID=A0A2S0WCL5_9CORY|nr:hypothetical protein C3E79_02600 [Corynebacterium liangguodongii]
MLSAKPTAAIHSTANRAGDELFVTAAVDGEIVYSASRPMASRVDALGALVDAFIETWKHQSGGMILYMGDTTVRRLLADAVGSHPGLDLRSVVTGPRLKATGEAARAAHTPLGYDPCPPQVPRWKSHRVYAADASKQRGDNRIGIAYVGSTHRVRVGHVRADTIAEGEFAAVSLVLSSLLESRTAREVDILTDSLEAARKPSSESPVWKGRTFERECLRKLDNVQACGITVRVSWVRGHAGNPLNELADRAAVAARRCTQWKQSPNQHVASIRTDLRALLASTDPATFVPSESLPGWARPGASAHA